MIKFVTRNKKMCLTIFLVVENNIAYLVNYDSVFDVCLALDPLRVPLNNGEDIVRIIKAVVENSSIDLVIRWIDGYPGKPQSHGKIFTFLNQITCCYDSIFDTTEATSNKLFEIGNKFRNR